MINLKNFRQVAAKTPLELTLEPLGTLFLEAETGERWYEVQQDFAQDTMKVQYDGAGVIRAMSTDVSGFFPMGMSLAEVSEWPETLDINGGWVFNGERIVPRTYTQDERTAFARVELLQRMEAANRSILPLERAVRLGIATVAEREALDVLERYSVALDRLDLTADIIPWPDVPKEVK